MDCQYFISKGIVNILLSKMLDTLFKSLEDNGLKLEGPVQLTLPPITQPQGSFMGSMLRTKKVKSGQDNESSAKKILLNIANEYFVVGRANTLVLYKYSILLSPKPQIVECHVQHLRGNIVNLYSCPKKFTESHLQLPVIVQFADALQYVQLDVKALRLTPRNQIRCSAPINTLGMISEREALVLTNNLELQYLVIQNHKMVEKLKRGAELEIGQKEILSTSTFLGVINEEQDAIIRLFYVTTSDSFQKLRVKQYSRTIDLNILTDSTNYLVGVVPGSDNTLGELNVTQAGEFFLAQSTHQVLVIKKKFGRYLFMDTVSQKVYNSRLIMSKEGLICSLGRDTFQLSFLKLADPKSHSRMLDSIQVDDPTLSDRFNKVWTFIQKQTSIMFVFEKEGKLNFYGLVKMDPMDKMIERVNRSKKEELTVIQELASNLGIPKKEFYLRVWASSKKELINIHDYLLSCECVDSIKRELRNWLRRKKMKVFELLKILEKMTDMVLQQLKFNLGVPLLKEYVKLEFLRRKFKLENVNRDIDHRDFQKVYDASIMDIFVEAVNDDLYPQKPVTDPLHATVQPIIKDEKNIKHVFQEFKLPLLENYSEFIINFLGHFKNDIYKVMQKYFYLLPKYEYNLEVVIISEDQALNQGSILLNETQANSSSILARSIIQMVGKQQPVWFSNVMPSIWKRQMSQEKLEKYLHDFYSTSTILSVINSFAKSNYGRQSKLQRHGLINRNHIEFKRKVQSMNGTKLYLRVCQFANESAVKLNLNQSATDQLIKLFQDKLHLEGVALEELKLYSQMHYFMLKYNIFDGKKITVEALIELGKKPQNLVAMFFLGNRQKKNYLLRQFKALYNDNPREFNFVLEQFIFSENCSRIQLELIVSEMRQFSSEFQRQHQELIDLIIRGFCRKLQLREEDAVSDFLKQIEHLELTKTLAYRVNEIVQLKTCADIFHHFDWSKKTYEDILVDPRMTMVKLLESYFNQEMKSMDITIEEEYFSLQFSRNMLNILLYLKENIFYDLKERDVLMTYGEMLVQWKQFDVVKALIYDENIPDKLEFPNNQYVEELMRNTLEQIYVAEYILYDEETKTQIRNIIQLDQSPNSRFRIQEQAKLALAEIFQGWSCTVRPHDIYIVTNQWSQHNRDQFIEDLIDQYMENMNFTILMQIYQLLQMSHKGDKDEINIRNPEFVKYCITYCRCLRDCKRYEDVIETLSFIKGTASEDFEIIVDYELQSEAFLRGIVSNFSENLEAGRKYIQFYYEKETDAEELHNIFYERLHPSCIQLYTPFESVKVDNALFFKNAKDTTVSISTDVLWNLATAESDLNAIMVENNGEEQIQTKVGPAHTSYYNYFFLLMMTKQPDLTLSRVHKISYIHEKILNAINRLEIYIDEQPQLWPISVIEIYARMQKGFYLEAITRIPNVRHQLQGKKDVDSTQKFQLQIIKNLLKADREKNNQLLRTIARVENCLETARGQKHNRQKRYKQWLKDLQEKEKEKRRITEAAEQEQEQLVDELNVTIKFSELRGRKKDITNRSAFYTERDIIEQVFDDLNQSKFNSPQRKGFTKFSMLLNSKKQTEDIEKITELILNQQYEQIKYYEEEAIKQAAQNVFYDQKNTFKENLTRLDCLGLIDPHKMEIGRYCDLFKNDISDSDLKVIFSFDMLTRKLDVASKREVSPLVFGEIQGTLKQFLHSKREEDVYKLAQFLGRVIEDQRHVCSEVDGGQRVEIDKYYEKKSIALALEAIANKEYCSDNILKIRSYVQALGEDQTFLSMEIKRIIKAYEKNPQFYSSLKDNVLRLNNVNPKVVASFDR